MVLATIIVLSNLAAIAVDFFYLFIAQVANKDSIADLARNRLINIIDHTHIHRPGSVGGRARHHRQQGGPVRRSASRWSSLWWCSPSARSCGLVRSSVSFSLDWFNPFSGLTVKAFRRRRHRLDLRLLGRGLASRSVSRRIRKTPGRAGLLAVITILLTYLLVAVAVMMMYAGVGARGVDLVPDDSENVFQPWPPRCWAAWARL